MVEQLSSVRLPGAEEVEIVLVRLSDGRVVARTREELEAAAGATAPPKEAGA